MCTVDNEVIFKTLEELKEMYAGTSNTPVLFPFYCDNKTKRVSEQELRICLIKNLLGDGCRGISIETPTKHVYRFKGGVKVDADCGDERSESARMDLTLLNGASFDAIFELKAHASTKQEALYQDFVKLTQEDAGQKFFVMIFEGLSESLKRNFKKRFNDCFEEGVRYLDGRKEDILQMCYFYDIKDASTAPETYTKNLKAYLRK